MNNSEIRQTMEQRWFPGVHCNIGGGYPDRGLSDQALSWLIEKAGTVGLCFDEEKLKAIQIAPNYKGSMGNSYTLPYWFWRRVWRKISGNNDVTNEHIDESVRQRMKFDKCYKPKNMKGLT